MKFGRKISTSLYNEWRPYYLDYSALKRQLKDRTLGREWSDKDEQDFTEMLGSELDKIHDFQKSKTSELSRRIREAEVTVQQFVNESLEYNENREHAEQYDSEAQQQQESYGDDQDSDDDGDYDNDDTDGSIDALEDRFHALEEEVATLVADVHDLALYTKLNITGFMKILKKHDKRTGLSLKTSFAHDYLEKRPFYKYNWDALIVKLSNLYNLVRTRGNPVQGDSSAGGSQSAFVRQTTKYWVHPDNLVPLKLAILRYLPVLVFDAEKEFDPKDSAITSIYFDNEDLELYLGRLEKTEGAEAIRLRWYGDVTNKTIFVERKTHREDWTGEKSVKARFPIKEHLVNAFLSGEYTVDEEFQQLVAKGKKTQAEVDSMIQLANEVQYAVITRNLKPVMRSFYNRTAFQLPGDARVRISLDTELALVREDNWEGKSRAGDNWRRTDIGIDHPFEQAAKEDKELFKYGVLEVKLQTQFGQEPPQWVTELVQSHLVEAVPKFSKFIHGCATLLPNRVDLVPFWLPQMDIDILKPDVGYLSVIERPNATPSKGSSDQHTSESNTPVYGATEYNEPVSEGEEDDDRALAPAKDEDRRTGLTGNDFNEAIAFRERMLKERRESEVAQQRPEVKRQDYDENNAGPSPRHQEQSKPGTKADRALPIDPLAPSSAFDATLRERLQGAQKSSVPTVINGNDDQEEAEEEGLEPPSNGDDRLLVSDFAAPPGKRISVPIRIEPKVYFACERTFLKWMNISVFIGTIATTLLNFLPPEDTRGLISAALFTFAALLAIAYAAIIFVFRAYRLRQRRTDGLYYDKYGPTVLSLVLLAALGTNLGLRVGEM